MLAFEKHNETELDWKLLAYLDGVRPGGRHFETPGNQPARAELWQPMYVPSGFDEL